MLVTPELIERFWGRVRVLTPDECWLWQGATNGGYGVFMASGERWYAHRVSWVIAHGTESPEPCTRHLCNARGCVNPKHLKPGTHAENAADRVRRQRETRRVVLS